MSVYTQSINYAVTSENTCQAVRPGGAQKRICFKFFNTGCCPQVNCRYQHVDASEVQKKRSSSVPPCVAFRKTGKCDLGVLCPYRHDVSTSDGNRISEPVIGQKGLVVVPVEKSSKKRLCFEFANTGVCKYGEHCSYRHVQRICFEFVNSGRCSRDSCNYLHVQDDKLKLCRTFARKGTCPYGDECRYSHDKANKIRKREGATDPARAVLVESGRRHRRAATAPPPQEVNLSLPQLAPNRASAPPINYVPSVWAEKAASFPVVEPKANSLPAAHPPSPMDVSVSPVRAPLAGPVLVPIAYSYQPDGDSSSSSDERSRANYASSTELRRARSSRHLGSRRPSGIAGNAQRKSIIAPDIFVDICEPVPREDSSEPASLASSSDLLAVPTADPRAKSVSPDELFAARLDECIRSRSKERRSSTGFGRCRPRDLSADSAPAVSDGISPAGSYPSWSNHLSASGGAMSDTESADGRASSLPAMSPMQMVSSSSAVSQIQQPYMMCVPQMVAAMPATQPINAVQCFVQHPYQVYYAVSADGSLVPMSVMPATMVQVCDAPTAATGSAPLPGLSE